MWLHTHHFCWAHRWCLFTGHICRWLCWPQNNSLTSQNIIKQWTFFWSPHISCSVPEKWVSKWVRRGRGRERRAAIRRTRCFYSTGSKHGREKDSPHQSLKAKANGGSTFFYDMISVYRTWMQNRFHNGTKEGKNQQVSQGWQCDLCVLL